MWRSGRERSSRRREDIETSVFGDEVEASEAEEGNVVAEEDMGREEAEATLDRIAARTGSAAMDEVNPVSSSSSKWGSRSTTLLMLFFWLFPFGCGYRTGEAEAWSRFWRKRLA